MEIKIFAEGLNEEINSKVFPLHTIQSMATRWGVTRQVVKNWAARHNDFCVPVKGIVAGSIQYYPLYEVERYEAARGLKSE